MKMKKMISFVLCTVIAASLFLMSGCEKKEAVDGPVINPVEITISVDYPSRSELKDIEDEPFTIEENSTVLEAIQLYCNVNDLPITVETTGGTVVGIEDLLNGDIFASRTWQFKINDVLSERPADEVKLKDGDSLKWVYIKPQSN